LEISYGYGHFLSRQSPFIGFEYDISDFINCFNVHDSLLSLRVNGARVDTDDAFQTFRGFSIRDRISVYPVAGDRVNFLYADFDADDPLPAPGPSLVFEREGRRLAIWTVWAPHTPHQIKPIADALGCILTAPVPVTWDLIAFDPTVPRSEDANVIALAEHLRVSARGRFH